MKILIADDSEFMRTLLKNTVHEAWPEAELVETNNGEAAISQFQTTRPDLVLLDIMMPDKTGLEVLKEIGSATPVLIISAAGQENVIEEAKQLGARDFIVKPFEKERVIPAIQAALSESAAASTNTKADG